MMHFGARLIPTLFLSENEVAGEVGIIGSNLAKNVDEIDTLTA